MRRRSPRRRRRSRAAAEAEGAAAEGEAAEALPRARLPQNKAFRLLDREFPLIPCEGVGGNFRDGAYEVGRGLPVGSMAVGSVRTGAASIVDC